VIAVFAARGRGIVVAGLIVVVTTAANLVAGTIWWMAIGFGIANAAEAWLVPAITRYGRRPGGRFRHPDAMRYLIATAGGAGAVGMLVGVVVALNGGDLLSTAAHVAASHGSSVLLLGVLGVIARPSFIPRRVIELLLQAALLGGTVIIAFGPGTYLPVAFLIIPVMAWAAFRFTAGVTLIEVAVVSVAVTVLSFLDGGAFAAFAAGDAELLIGLIQLFTLALGISLLPLAVAQDDRTDLFLRLSAREQLLRGAIVSSHAGFIVARREDGGIHRVVESNPNGERMLADWLTTDGEKTLVDSTRLADLVESTAEGVMTDVAFPDGRHLEVSASVVAADTTLLLIQAIDVTEQTKAARALADAFVHEREAADRLRALAAQKDEFVSSVSHELRTPVTSILGYTEDLVDADLPEGERRSVEVIMRNARRLADLVEDLLNVSREAGQSGGEASAVDLHSAIRQCVEDLSAIAERAHVTVELADANQVHAARRAHRHHDRSSRGPRPGRDRGHRPRHPAERARQGLRALPSRDGREGVRPRHRPGAADRARSGHPHGRSRRAALGRHDRNDRDRGTSALSRVRRHRSRHPPLTAFDPGSGASTVPEVGSVGRRRNPRRFIVTARTRSAALGATACSARNDP
jgi:two-component system phosphate regulon sensor histidine kinase PhoR